MLAKFAMRFGREKITLRNPHPHVLKVLQICRFDTIFNIETNG